MLNEILDIFSHIPSLLSERNLPVRWKYSIVSLLIGSVAAFVCGYSYIFLCFTLAFVMSLSIRHLHQTGGSLFNGHSDDHSKLSKIFILSALGAWVGYLLAGSALTLCEVVAVCYIASALWGVINNNDEIWDKVKSVFIACVPIALIGILSFTPFTVTLFKGLAALGVSTLLGGFLPIEFEGLHLSEKTNVPSMILGILQSTSPPLSQGKNNEYASDYCASSTRKF